MKKVLALILAVIMLIAVVGCSLITEDTQSSTDIFDEANEMLDEYLDNPLTNEDKTDNSEEETATSGNTTSSDLEHNVDIYVNCDENLFFSRYDVDVYANDNYLGKVEHGKSITFSTILPSAPCTFKFVSLKDDSLNGEKTLEISKDSLIEFKIYCTSDGISILDNKIHDVIYNSEGEGTAISSDNHKIITVTMSEDEFIGLPAADAEKSLIDMGFSNITYDTIEINSDKNLDGTIAAVEIKTWQFGKGDFSKGDEYEDNAYVVLWYYKYAEPEQPEAVYYSTNDYDTAKFGNSGKFAYIDEGQYDIYWIIDFDEGYVYYFTEGNGDNSCDKLKIEEGNLNTGVKITYHMDNDKWSYYLHFEYSNIPTTLIVVDNDGFDYSYTPTNLEKALEIMSAKTTTEY